MASRSLRTLSLAARPRWPRPPAPTRPRRPARARRRRDMSTTAPNPDPRVGLKAGLMDAGEAVVEPAGVSKTPPSDEVRRRAPTPTWRSPGNYAIQGNYNGYQVWDISQPGAADARRRRTSARRRRATSRSTRTCSSSRARASPAGSTAAREGVKDTVSKDRLRGLRIFDITDIAHPEERRQRADLPRLAHAHACSSIPKDTDNVYVYISGSARRPLAERAAGLRRARCRTRIPNSALFRIEVIKVPLAHPSRRRSSARRASSTT